MADTPKNFRERLINVLRENAFALPKVDPVAAHSQNLTLRVGEACFNHPAHGLVKTRTAGSNEVV
jgi:hypothetical protein